MNLGKFSAFELIEKNSKFLIDDFRPKNFPISSSSKSRSSSESALLVTGNSVHAIVKSICAALQNKHSLFLVRDTTILQGETSNMIEDFLSKNTWQSDNSESIVWMQSSGTTGRPKWIPHHLNRICSVIATGKKRATWLLCFEPTSFAGLQVILSALLGGHRLVCPGTESTPSEIAQLAAEYKITHMSATPTFWRSFLRASRHMSLFLKHITLGGEVADQATLDALKQRYTNATIRHIYATTEIGVVMTVQDGKEGFPASWLGSNMSNGIGLSISKDDTLLVRNSKIRLDQPDCYWDTRDVVKVNNDRVYFKGRADTLINIGGLKVFPEEIESYLLKLSEISDVRISSLPSPITGQILIAEIVPNGDLDTLLLQKKIEDHLTALPRYARPALLRFKDQISNLRTGKKSRS